MTLYEELIAAGVEVDNHCSDLYFPRTEETTAILNRHELQRSIAEVFTNQVTGGLWYDVPFAYYPYWEKHQ